MRRILAALITLSAFLAAPHRAIGSGNLPPQPEAPKRTVVDTYWGVSVPDDYQYMEDAQDSAAANWSQEQNAHTRAWLDQHAERKSILERVTALTHSDSPDYYGARWQNGYYFVMKEQPPKQQPLLVVLTSVLDLKTERVVVDPTAIDPSGKTSIDFYVPSLDGRLVAVSLSKGGTEDGSLHFYETATGRALSDVIPRVNGGTAGGSAAWTTDGSGVYYTRYPREGERPAKELPFYQQIYFHRMGAPTSEDTYVLGKEFPKIAEIKLTSSPDGQHVLADVSNGDGGEHAFWILSPGGSWNRISTFVDGVIEAKFGMDGSAYLLSRRDAPRKKILRLPLATPNLRSASVSVSEGENPIVGYTPTAGRIYVVETVGGPTQLRVYDLSGRALGVVGGSGVSLLGTPVHTIGDGILVRSQSYTRPPAYYAYGPDATDLTPTALAHVSPADFSDCEVRREYATAADGTKLPVNILLRKGTKLDGSSPAILYGYGSYGLTETPAFRAELKAWLEQGGIWVDASIRGGGEFGDAWHEAARLGTKKVSMDDFAACARYLVERGYTRKERLAIEGGSAGGLLVYGTLVHYPDYMHAAVAHVGYGDVLRTELAPNGEFNTTEFGTVKDSTQFRGMYAYSPYHHVKNGTQYPSILALTGANDPRVPAWETYKMVARLQASGSRNPVLMRVNFDFGHGIGTSLTERDQATTDVLMFLFDRLGVKYRPVARDTKSGKQAPSL